ncbi:MAG: C40 family peptidase [Bacteroidia bacterium]
MIGICILSNIPLRKEPDSKSEMTSQLLFGNTFQITEQEDDWAKIISDEDGYEGWISARQFEKLDKPVRKKIISTSYPFVEAVSGREKTMIVPGSTIPDPDKDEFFIGNKKFILSKTPLPAFTFKDIAEVSKQYLNVPYLWGGCTPFGIDCSGLTQMVYRQCGIQLKRDAWLQAELGDIVEFRETAKCGDLAFFDNAEGKIVHVGIILEPGKIIHASGKVRIDLLDDHGILNSDEKKYSHKLRIIKRIVR